MGYAVTGFVGLLLSAAVSIVGKGQEQDVVTQQNPKDAATMIRIQDGEFLMGSNEDEIEDQFRRFGYQSDWKKHGLDEIPRHLSVGQRLGSFPRQQRLVSRGQGASDRSGVE